MKDEANVARKERKKQITILETWMHRYSRTLLYFCFELEQLGLSIAATLILAKGGEENSIEFFTWLPIIDTFVYRTCARTVLI